VDAVAIRLVYDGQAVVGTMPLQRKNPPTWRFRRNTAAQQADDEA
jgi:hypothetical protein